MYEVQDRIFLALFQRPLPDFLQGPGIGDHSLLIRGHGDPSSIWTQFNVIYSGMRPNAYVFYRIVQMDDCAKGAGEIGAECGTLTGRI